MRSGIFKLWHLVQKRNDLMRAATNVSSPGFEQHYGSYCTDAPFEKYVIESVDMQEDIDEAVGAVVRSIEEDNKRLLTEYSGQRQRAQRLRIICNKSISDIANQLGVNEKTAVARMEGLVEKLPENEFALYCLETRLLSIDEEVEMYIARTYRLIEDMVEERYREVDRLIQWHQDRAKAIREQYEQRIHRIESFIDGLSGKEQIIVKLWYEGASWKEIANTSGYSVSHAKKIFSQIGKNDTFFS